MANNYIINNKVYTSSQIIENALQQETEGIKPHYTFYDYNNKKPVTPLGWLVWSTIENGVGVVFRRNDGKMMITTGVQGDFCYM